MAQSLLVFLLAHVPKISADDPRSLEFNRTGTRQLPGPYRNNLYMAFIAIWGINESCQIELERFTNQERAWNQFVTYNGELFSKIRDCLDEINIFSGEGSRRLFEFAGEKEANNEYRKMQLACGHLLGMNAITVWVFDRLNPLLQEADSKMHECGIKF